MTVIPTCQSCLCVQPLTQPDLDAVADVLARTFHPPEGLEVLFFPLRKRGIREELRTRLLESATHYCCLAAFYNYDVVGTAEVSLRRIQHKVRPYVANLAVKAEWRRLGVGRQLLLSAERLAKTWGYGEVCLHVLKDNAVAQQFYRRLGYGQDLTLGIDWWTAGLTLLGLPEQLALSKRLPPP